MENILGTGKISKLILKFAIPCIISMVVAALYNIVDQIFIGWSEAAEYGNAATNIVYPFTVFALGFALLVGDGIAANFSLFLGGKNKDRANKTFWNGILLLVTITIILTLVAFIFKKNILSLFGANPEEELCYKFADNYYTIICIGIPFYMIGQGLNGSIRADGSPTYAMICTFVGAIANIILDPIFIFVFKLDVKGAAIATIISQLITFVITIAYFFKSKNINFKKGYFKVEFNLITKIITVGLASLIVQLSIVAISAVNNNLFSKYGYETYSTSGKLYGAIIPLAIVGIVMKIFGIVISIIVGVGLGGQPIIGYNQGAGNFDRVKKTIKYLNIITIGIGIVAFLIFELFPNFIISIFGNSGSFEYQEFAKYTVRIFLSGIVLTCYIKETSIVLQSLGNSLKSTIVALTRDVIVFIPTTIIIASLSHNIVTMLWAALISDCIGAIVSFILLHTELRKLSK